MRLIDVDKVTNKDICMALGIKYASCASDVRELLDEQPTVKPQCIANIKFEKEDIEELIEQKVKEAVEFSYDYLKELLMEYFRIGVDCYAYNLRDKLAFECGTVTVNDFEEFNEEMIDDIIDFIKSRTRIMGDFNFSNKILIDSTEFQQKVLDYISSCEIDKMINATVFKDNQECKQAIIYGMVIASMLTSKCKFYELIGRIDE